MVGSLQTLIHPLHDVAARADFPFMDARRMAERYEFVPNPKSPIAIAAIITNENISHGALPLVTRASSGVGNRR